MAKSILEVFGEKSQDADGLIELMESYIKQSPSFKDYLKNPFLSSFSKELSIPSEYDEKYVDPWIFRDMIKSSKELSPIFGNIYDLEGRIEKADLPEKYSFEEMNYPLGSSSAADYDINIMDVLDQRNMLDFLVDKMQKSTSSFRSEEYGAKPEDVNKSLEALSKLKYMIDASLQSSKSDIKKRKDVSKKELDILRKQFPGEFD